jgi:hypothetical protein
MNWLGDNHDDASWSSPPPPDPNIGGRNEWVYLINLNHGQI